jgi:hypothetical protein
MQQASDGIGMILGILISLVLFLPEEGPANLLIKVGATMTKLKWSSNVRGALRQHTNVTPIKSCLTHRYDMVNMRSWIIM